uniref:TNF superfamily member 13b n=1 Tax=Anser cygnoides TaxID=8845 RepID=A0A8B9IEQ3_ANSCY
MHFKPICVKSVKLHSVEEVEKHSVLLDSQTSEAVRQVRAPFPLCTVSLYHVLTLKTELEALRHELIYRVQARSPLERPAVSPDDEKAGAPVSSFLQASAAGARQENKLPGPSPAESFRNEISNGSRNRGRRSVVHTEETVLQACLQLIADSKSDIQQKDDSSIVPWLLSFKRGTALEEHGNKIVIKETGYFFIYGQVLYTDTTFAMGHLIQRKKAHVFGDDLSLVTLFRCIQNMPQSYPNNSCYTAGKHLYFPSHCLQINCIKWNLKWRVIKDCSSCKENGPHSWIWLIAKLQNTFKKYSFI